MIKLKMDRGFESMLPVNDTEDEKETVFEHGIMFNLFNREFKFQFQVNKMPE